MSKQNIVTVGGGGAGVITASVFFSKLRSHSDQYDLIIISPRDCYIHIPALMRMAVTTEDNLEETALIPIDNILANGIGRLKVGKAVQVIPTSESGEKGGGVVLLESGEEVPFRYLVLATGSHWEGPLSGLPGTTADFFTAIRDWRLRLSKAQSIVIIGGGPVGLELAGELRDVYSTKKITIVHSRHLLLNDAYPEKFRKDVQRRWESRNIEFILNNRLSDYPVETGGMAVTSSGMSISADLFVPVCGGRPNTAFLKSLGDDVLDARGYVRIAPTLQLTHYPSIFAAGDIISFDEQKALGKTVVHARVIVANIMSLFAGESPKATYSGSVESVFITNGKTKGAGYVGILWGLTFGDKVVPMVKGKDLTVSRAKKFLDVA